MARLLTQSLQLGVERFQELHKEAQTPELKQMLSTNIDYSKRHLEVPPCTLCVCPCLCVVLLASQQD